MYSVKGIVIGLLSLILLSVGCKRKETTWDVDNTAPLFRSNLTLNDVDNDFLKQTSSDSSYSLVYDNLIFDSRLYDIETPDTSILTSFNLERLKLLDNAIENYITLGQINPSFNLANGQTLTLPATSQSNLPPQTIDASEFFETATFNKGFLDITITNELPITLTRLDFELQNQTDKSIVANGVFLNLTTNSSETKSIDLAGKTINKGLLGIINLIETAASSGAVLVDVGKGIRISLSLRDLEPQSATAAFPNQTVVDRDESLVIEMDGPELKTFKVASGNLSIEIESTIQEDMTLDFRIPSATINGTPLKRVVKFPGAKPGQSWKETEVVDLTGYVLDLRGENPTVRDTFNTFHQILKILLDSSGRKVTITLDDSINVSYRLEVLQPEYSVGYMGQTVNPSVGKTAFELFKGLSGTANVTNFKTTLIAKNSIGVDGTIQVNKLDGENIFGNTKKALTSSIFDNPIAINKPSFLSRTPAETEIELNAGNSTINDFIGNFPQWIDYDIEVNTNPNGNLSAWRDFVFDDSRLQLYLRLESDANFAINNLILRDTQAVDFGNVDDYKRLKQAFLLFRIENQFPVGAEIEITLLDQNQNFLTNLDVKDGNNLIAGSSGLIQGQTGAISHLEIGLGKEKIKYLANAKFVKIKTNLTSPGSNVKIYNWQRLLVSCNVRFEYEPAL